MQEKERALSVSKETFDAVCFQPSRKYKVCSVRHRHEPGGVRLWMQRSGIFIVISRFII